MNPIRLLLAFFGYVKIPYEAVLLAMELERWHEALHKRVPNNEAFKQLHDASKTITHFLRSGRIISS